PAELSFHPVNSSSPPGRALSTPKALSCARPRCSAPCHTIPHLASPATWCTMVPCPL
ncbi:hypothetical protein DENSPDRAFT_845971, partial [Dentipellis sp. KUC8613]